MSADQGNRFQDFFILDEYTRLKNYLYNYLLRKRAVEGILAQESPDLILEVGCGVSPVMTKTDRIVYAELSFLACRTLKQAHGRGWYVTADVRHLPFRAESFSHANCSEVLEHIEDDQAAIAELARVLCPGGRLIVTFPHRQCYFANDDRYVRHFRRYELHEMIERLAQAGLRTVRIQKVLGPLERLTMMTAVWCYEMTQRLRRNGAPPPSDKWLKRFAPFFKWANRMLACPIWLDARIMPQSWAAVLLIVAEKQGKTVR